MANPLYDILNKYPYEIKKEKSSRLKQVLFVKSSDRSSTKKEIEKELLKKKIGFVSQKNNALSGSIETTVIPYDFVNKGAVVVLVYKPASGGMSETTLNSTITELAPALAFTHGYKPKSVDDFYSFLKTVDHKKSSVYVIPRDVEAGRKFVDEFPKSSKFKEKMENAMGVLKYLEQENKKNPINNVYWGYREKPKGIDSKHKGDLFVEYRNGSMVGVSLKAGDANSKEPKLNTYVNPILETLYPKGVNELRQQLWDTVYKTFTTDQNGYDKGGTKREVIKQLSALERADLKTYDELYNINLDIIRNELTKVFEYNVKNTVDYLNVAIAGKDDSVPLLVIKAYGTNYMILTDEDDVAVFLPKVKSIKSYPSTTSKQDFYIELIASATEKLKLKFAVRTNKTGDEHKLGQFFNLAVKFNGIV